MIEACALKNSSGLMFVLPKPARHTDIIDMVRKTTDINVLHLEQGFLWSENGEFLTRQEAMRRARAMGQLKNNTYNHDHLFSEDLW